MYQLSLDEEKVLQSPDAAFPMLMAASAAMKRCPTCGGHKIDPRPLLGCAVTRYMYDENFKAYLKRVLGHLPTTLAGIEVKA